ncbi:hypothetical protein BTS2_0134 [Bacillus sp. TS-2]|nr:hypothetical protein BTS2_0134 [Bacillus sp. TS-2]
MIKKRTVSIGLITLLIMPSFFIQPSAISLANETNDKGSLNEKDEVVYVNLSPTGEVSEAYVVNYLNVTEPGVVEDFGPYTKVTNLTDLTEIELSDGKVEMEAQEGIFYYQGNLEQEVDLPWDISVSYQIDGQEQLPENLIGVDGKLKVEIESKQNSSIDPSFFENYMLQISINLEEEKFSNVTAPDAMLANAGKNKQVTFTVLPEKEETFIIEADVLDFEWDGIEIAAVPASMPIEFPDTDEMTEGMVSLSDAINDLHEGVVELNDGMNQFTNGFDELSSGSQSFQSGLKDVANGGNEIISGSESLKDALTQINQSLNGDLSPGELGDLEELFQGLAAISNGMNEAADGLSTLSGHYSTAFQALDEAVSTIPEKPLTEEDIMLLYQSGADSEVVDTLVANYQAAQTVKATYAAVKEGFQVVEPALKESSNAMKEMSQHVSEIGQGLSVLEDLDVNELLQPLQDGLKELSSHYNEFHAGLRSYTDGVNQLSSSYQSLHGGIIEMKDGASELSSGTNELEKGTKELADVTSKLPEEMQEEIDQMIAEFDKSDFEAISFTSSENNEVISSVQFVMKTEALKKDDSTADEEEEETNEGFWQRFLNLFKRN